MPVIRYTLKLANPLGEDSFSEQDTFPPTDDPEKLIGETIVKPLNDKRYILGEHLLVLERVEVLNPYVHAHSWKKYKVDKFVCKAKYECTRCGITGYRPAMLFTGESGGPIMRDEEFKNAKFEHCKDPLKELPKKLSF